MKIIILDDDSIVLMSLKMIVEAAGITVAATGTSGTELEELYFAHKPDVVLSDIRMEGMDGITAAEGLLNKEPGAKILFLTTFSDEEYITNALKCGAKGYILKQDYEGIVPAVMAVNLGHSVFGGEVVNKMPAVTEKSDINEKLEKAGITSKEYEVIKLVAEGMSNKEIAAELFLGEGTVRNYLSSILDKLDLRDRTQLVVYYYKNS